MKTLFIKISDFMYSNGQSFFLFIESCVHKSLNFYSYVSREVGRKHKQ